MAFSNGCARAVALALLLVAGFRPCPAQTRLDYRPYFASVRTALTQVAAEDFRGALATYQQTFRRYRRVFPRDAFNALQLAILLADGPARDSLVRRGAESGVSRKTFLQNPRVRGAFLPADSGLFEQLFLAGRAIWATRVDTALRREMMERYKWEQESKTSPEYGSVCTNNFNRIAALARTGRFPGEGRIGVDDDLRNSYVIPTLCHYPYSYRLLQKELHAAMLEGQIQPLSIIYPYGFNQSMTSALYKPHMQRDTVTYAKRYNTAFGLKSADTAAVNRARAGMFIVSVETERRLEAVAQAHGIAIELGW